MLQDYFLFTALMNKITSNKCLYTKLKALQIKEHLFKYSYKMMKESESIIIFNTPGNPYMETNGGNGYNATGTAVNKFIVHSNRFQYNRKFPSECLNYRI